MSYSQLFAFEQALANYTGAPYCVVTDGCTHALELCFRLDRVTHTEFTAFTYLSVPQLMHQLNIHYELRPDYWSSIGEYPFSYTNIWDSARRLEPNMYRTGQKQCLSFGHGKILELGKGGAILLDKEWEYLELSKMRSDGRDLRINPWQEQTVIGEGYHYCPTLELCAEGLVKLNTVKGQVQPSTYPDLRKVNIDHSA